MEQSLRHNLIKTADAYAVARGLSRSRVSTLVFNGGHVLDRVAVGGGDVTTSTFERAQQWFSDNWPDGLAWPDGVARPLPLEQEVA